MHIKRNRYNFPHILSQVQIMHKYMQFCKNSSSLIDTPLKLSPSLGFSKLVLSPLVSIIISYFLTISDKEYVLSSYHALFTN